MTRDQADRFAKCLRANERFTAVSVCHSAQAKSERRWFVTFAPSSTDRRLALLEGHQNSRIERALSEGNGYVFVPDPDARFVWCLSTSGEVYEVTDRGCSCPDHRFRCGPAGIACKHTIALTQGVGTMLDEMPTHPELIAA